MSPLPAAKVDAKKPFWSFSIAQTLAELKTTERGLSTAEASKRLEQLGPNTLIASKPRTRISILASQFTSPLIVVLLIAGVITIGLGDYNDALFILLAAFVNAGLGFYQENKAERALEHLTSYITSRIRVLRDGADHEIDTTELVPGDIIKLSQGERIPADVRIIHSNDLRIDQAVLTGESMPVEKNSQQVTEDAELGDRRCMAFAGTMVTDGVGNAVVTLTDDTTEFGSIAKAVANAATEQTPLQKALRTFTLKAGAGILLMSGGLFFIAASRGLPLLDSFLIAVAILVAAVPEGLPIITTVILAIGVQRLSKRKGIVRRLTAAETLGSTSVILTDKTGTLTQAKMSLAAITIFEAEPAIKESISQEAFLLHAALLNVDALIENPSEDHSNWKLVGKPLEVALVKAAASKGVHFPTVKAGKEALHLLPFSSLNKFSASVYKMPSNWYNARFKAKEPYVLTVLGAPDILLTLSDLNEIERLKITSALSEMATRGERVIGVAVKEITNPDSFHFKNNDHLAGLRFLGMLSFKDPLRPGAAKAITEVQKLGIRVIIVTGDHEETASAIARELGILTNPNECMRGSEFDSLSDEDLTERMKTLRIVARVSPAAKLRIVKLLQKQGEIVAMTGDGINDAPALREANIGVAMGSGTDVSQDVADLVLLDDNFETIVAAVTEGRRILSNLRKAIVYLTSTILDEIVLIGGSLLMGVANPINALQILWINFLTESGPGITLAFEKNIDGKNHRSARGVFTNEMRYLIGINGVLNSFLLFCIYYGLLKMGFDPLLTSTFIYACLGTCTLFVLGSIRNLKASIFTYNPFSNLYLTISVAFGFTLTLAGVYLPFLQKYFNTVSLPPIWLAGVVGFGLVSICLVELTKLIFRKEAA